MNKIPISSIDQGLLRVPSLYFRYFVRFMTSAEKLFSEVLLISFLKKVLMFLVWLLDGPIDCWIVGWSHM